jgi:release factor glutamine methyltransferase
MASTIDQILRQATQQLAASSPSPRLDAEALLLHVTGLTRATLIIRAHETLAPEYAARLDALLARRVHGEPVAYLTGTREFWSLPLTITPDVLIPRPETELLVEQALQRIPPDAAWLIADLGTGSGAVALAIASERPRCQVIATDASAAALAVARANGARLGIGNIEFRHGEWFAPLAGETFGLIVSNPPYVAEGDPHLSQGDVRFEPPTALIAGADGLVAIRVIAHDARRHLRPGGSLLIEHGFDQAAAMRALLTDIGYREATTFTDLQGHSRVSAGQL